MRDALDWSKYLRKVQQCWEGNLDRRVGDIGHTVTQSGRIQGKQRKRPESKKKDLGQKGFSHKTRFGG